VSGSGANPLSRRDFIKGMAVVIGGLVGTIISVPSIAFLLSPAIKSDADSSPNPMISLGRLANYPIGVPGRFDFTRTQVNGWERTATNFGIYVVRKNESEIRVFSDICTHLACRVSWHADQEHYISPCHNGRFDILGNVVSGLPPRPLDEFVTKIEEGELFAQLPAFRRES